jgi:V8-like Glu-specific endopeptidase
MKVRRVFVLTTVLVVALMLTSAAGAVSPPQQGGEDPNQIVTSGPVVQTHDEIVAYWTPERMREAKPYPMPDVTKQAKAKVLATEPDGPLFITPGGSPEEARQLDLLKEGDRATLGYSYPPPFSVHEVFPLGLYTWYPWRTVGKVFFTSGGSNYVCSGSVMGGRAVWTAGHCVYDPDLGTWHTNWSFVPGYRDGLTPFGTWTAFDLVTLVGWVGGDLSYDIGAAAVSDRNGRKISWDTGYLGFMANAATRQHWNIFGYPAASPFNGQRQWNCQASISRRDTSLNPASVGAGCNMTGGCSGGPWIVNHDWKRPTQGSYNLVNGVVSYGYTGSPLELFSPYFGTGAVNVYNWGISQ